MICSIFTLFRRAVVAQEQIAIECRRMADAQEQMVSFLSPAPVTGIKIVPGTPTPQPEDQRNTNHGQD